MSHRGGVNGGHYTSHVYKAGRWWRCSDATVKAASGYDDHDPNFEPTLLFYRRATAPAPVEIVDLESDPLHARDVSFGGLAAGVGAGGGAGLMGSDGAGGGVSTPVSDQQQGGLAAPGAGPSKNVK